jgi:N-acetylmuramoyl-L-alanine amidase
MRVCIDPGHGGDNLGTPRLGVMLEKEYTLLLAGQLKSILSSTIKDVVLTRTDDSKVSFFRRGEKSKTSDLVISIHVNANAIEARHGMECYVRGHHKMSSDIAYAIADLAPRALRPSKVIDVDASRERWLEAPKTVIDPHTEAKAVVLVEVGYATNPKDRSYILSEGGQLGICAAMLGGVAFAWNLLKGESEFKGRDVVRS